MSAPDPAPYFGPTSGAPTTSEEGDALAAVGVHLWQVGPYDADQLVRAFRAGRRAAATTPPRVFRKGDPEPDDLVGLHGDGATVPGFYFIVRQDDPGAPDHRWRMGPRIWTWDQVMEREPLVEVFMPDVAAAIAADEQRRIAP